MLSLINSIEKIDENKIAQCKSRWNSLCKPLNSLGELESIICKIYAINGSVDIDKKCVAVMCADNGIVEENISQSKSDVTATVARNMLSEKATINIISSLTKSDVFVYDVGVVEDVDNIINKKIARGTKNFLKDKAMSYEDAKKTINIGINIVKELKEKGYKIIGVGEMGIGNTTTSSAVAAAFLGVDAKYVTGKGAGLSDESLLHKIEVINRAVALHKPNVNDPIDVLSKVGGFDIGAMCGVFLGGGIYKVPVVMDGLISYAAALIAYKLNQNVRDYMIASHSSAECATELLLNELGIKKAYLNFNMALGEGSGAVSMFPMLDIAVSIYKNLAQFKEAGIEEYVPL